MNRGTQIAALARRLEEAHGAGDVARLNEIYRELREVLPRLAAHGRVPAPEAAAWNELRRAHTLAQRQCDVELARLGQRLGELRTHREGWAAYALQDSPLGASA